VKGGRRMKVLGIVTSHRRLGNTEILVKEALRAAEEEGAEVESALIEHPAVAEAGAIGTPDPMVMEVIKAFVSLKNGYEPSGELIRNIKKFARKKLHAVACPRQIDFISGLPKTKSGKIMRRLLKARELGLPEGDTSTLEEQRSCREKMEMQNGTKTTQIG